MSTHEPEEVYQIQIQLLCSCGWGDLAMSYYEVELMTECPHCRRGFDSETGWEAS
jgi:hypothetical protein